MMEPQVMGGKCVTCVDMKKTLQCAEMVLQKLQARDSISALHRLYIGPVSALCLLCIGCTSAVHRLYIGCTSAVHWHYIGRTSGCTSAVH